MKLGATLSLIIISCLILFGFLIGEQKHLRSQIKQLNNENQRLKQELNVKELKLSSMIVENQALYQEKESIQKALKAELAAKETAIYLVHALQGQLADMRLSAELDHGQTAAKQPQSSEKRISPPFLSVFDLPHAIIFTSALILLQTYGGFTFNILRQVNHSRNKQINRIRQQRVRATNENEFGFPRLTRSQKALVAQAYEGAGSQDVYRKGGRISEY